MLRIKDAMVAGMIKMWEDNPNYKVLNHAAFDYLYVIDKSAKRIYKYNHKSGRQTEMTVTVWPHYNGNIVMGRFLAFGKVNYINMDTFDHYDGAGKRNKKLGIITNVKKKVSAS